MIRPALISDLPAIRRLFRDTILAINIRDYTEQQVAGWAANWRNEERWNERLVCDYFIVAERNNTITGFAALEANGHFKFLFVHKDYQRQGIATELVEAIELHARKIGLETLDSNVSITARPFMEKHGYTFMKKQETAYPEGVYINFRMEKPIFAGNFTMTI